MLIGAELAETELDWKLELPPLGGLLLLLLVQAATVVTESAAIAPADSVLRDRTFVLQNQGRSGLTPGSSFLLGC
jgi:hypothetical protein